MLEPGIKGHPNTLAREVEEFFRFKADALLARLEAAEAFGELAYQRLETGRQNDDTYDLYDAWRKASGKTAQ